MRLSPDIVAKQSAIAAALQSRRSAAAAEVNRIAGEARRAYITAIPGQDMVYLSKEAEARAYVAENPEPATLANYPLIAAEIGITAPTAYQLAQVWLFMGAQWRTIAAQVEALRLGSISQIDAAADQAAIDAILAVYSGAMA